MEANTTKYESILKHLFFFQFEADKEKKKEKSCVKKCGSEEFKKLLQKSSVMLEIWVGNISQKGCLTKKGGRENRGSKTGCHELPGFTFCQ